MNDLGPDGGELELSDYVAVLRRRWRWVAASLVLVVGAAVAFTLTQAPAYRATASVLVRSSTAEGVVRAANTNPGMLSRELSNEITFATSDDVERSVAARFETLPLIEVTGDKDADLLEFSATASTPGEAAHIANTWAQAYVARKQADALSSVAGASEQLTQRLESLKDERQALRGPHDELTEQLALTEDPHQQALLEAQIERAAAALAGELSLIAAQEQAAATAIANLELQAQLARTGNARIVSEAEAPEAPSNAPLSRNVPLALVVGAILGVAAALLRENLDKAVKDAEDVRRAVGVPVLATVPFQRDREAHGELGLATLSEPTSAVADAYHKLRTALQFAMLERDIHSVLMTSPNQGEGKTVSSANLAWALASVTPRVTLLDGDFRRPRVHEVYGVANTTGFSDHVLSGQRMGSLALRVEFDDASLSVVPTGPLPPNPADFVSSVAFSSSLKAVIQDSDLVVIDGPPVLPVSDALTLARSVDAVVVVARAGDTTIDELRSAVDALHQVGAHVLGIVLVGVAQSSRYGRYGYYGADTSTAHRTGGGTPRVTVPAERSEPAAGGRTPSPVVAGRKPVTSLGRPLG